MKNVKMFMTGLMLVSGLSVPAFSKSVTQKFLSRGGDGYAKDEGCKPRGDVLEAYKMAKKDGQFICKMEGGTVLSVDLVGVRYGSKAMLGRPACPEFVIVDVEVTCFSPDGLEPIEHLK